MSESPTRWVRLGGVAFVLVAVGIVAALRLSHERPDSPLSPAPTGGAAQNETSSGTSVDASKPDYTLWASKLNKNEKGALAAFPDAPQSYRELMIANFYLKHRLTGDVSQLDPFLTALRSHEPQDPTANSEDLFFKNESTALALGFLSIAWENTGPYETIETECIERTTACLTDPDEVIRIVAGKFLFIAREARHEGRLPPRVEAQFTAAMSNDAYRFEVERQVSFLRDQPK